MEIRNMYGTLAGKPGEQMLCGRWDNNIKTYLREILQVRRYKLN
jgi:hypothetical protein